jgi:hypothetical protein
MKNKLVSLLLMVAIVLIGYLVLKPIEQKDYSQQEIDNISNAFAKTFDEARKRNLEKTKASKKKPPTQADTPFQQSIIAVIYRRPQMTWFIKAKDSKENIDTISSSFKNYFIDQMNFDSNQQPDFSHIPDSMKTQNTSSMRVATFLIGEVEISVSQLAGEQDLSANIERWKRQIGAKQDSAVQTTFQDDKKTVIVYMSN